MKSKLPLTFCVLLVTLLTGFLWAQDPPPPRNEHQREKPAVACFPVKADKTAGCACMKEEKGKVCKDGKRMQESHVCSSYCWVEMCACCKS